LHSDPTVRKVLIYRLGSLGDMVVSLPCLHLIERAFPNSQRILLTNFPVLAKAPAAADVLGECGLVHGYMRYTVGMRSPRALLRLTLEVRRFNPDVLVYLMPLRSSKAVRRDKLFFRWACGTRRIVGAPAGDNSSRGVNPVTGLYEPEAARLARTLAELGDAGTADLANWSLRLTTSERLFAQTALGDLAGKPLIACGPGTKMQAKDWGQENWRSLLRRIAASYSGYGLVTIGAREDSAAGDYVCSDWNGPKLNLCGRLTPRQSAAVVEHTSLFLGPDSGPMHLAACANVPCVIAFSARGLPGVWYPAGENHHILYRQVSCRGCNLESCIVEARRCLTSITVDEMARQVDSVLSPRAGNIPKGANAGLQH
jgi:heptosyltransferase III